VQKFILETIGANTEDEEIEREIEYEQIKFMQEKDGP
jgi:hypothetical protein